ncbi:MAG: CDP-alcohol phosphatidyltransferase family protein [Candidatus Hydrogenedentes bacterium]|nr:CDP-alcohol phosphatidyltransferase family protein [Candidatus Hydrogenedentota bacterium]
MEQSRHSSFIRVVAAWLVHALTASGAVAGLLALIAIPQGHYKAAFLWMAVTIAIDSVDGFFARAARVREFAPLIDGPLLDNIVDYFTYVIVPAAFIVYSDIVPPGARLASAIAVTLASAYQFSQKEAKTPDHHFKGFPSYWNVTVFYLYLLGWPEWANLAILWILGIAVFVPVKYLYPSRAERLRGLTVSLTCLWGACMVWLLVTYPWDSWGLRYWSLLYVGYYFAASIALTISDTKQRLPC